MIRKDQGVFRFGFVVRCVASRCGVNSSTLGASDRADAIATVSRYDLLHSGQLRQFCLPESQGLVSLPSFHVMLALLLAYVVRHVRHVFLASVVLHVVMIVSTPTQGGHYLADVIAGIVFGVLSIAVVRRRTAGPRRAATAGPCAAHPA
nr:phosphatase PAP2 family protein [Burkholderia sp. D-99]